MNRLFERLGALLLVVTSLSLGAGAATTLSAQQPARAVRSLSLDSAIALAGPASETVGIAQAGVQRARGAQAQARSVFLPQLAANATYTRTLKSQFAGAFGNSTDTTSSGPDFSKLPFGQANSYALGLQGQWTLFNGMRNFAGASAAAADTRAAQAGLLSQRAALLLTTAEYYYDALLADRLVAIAESTLAQSEATLRETQLGFDVGNRAEFDLLRARVGRDNARPAVISQRAARDIAYLRLKQLLDLPLGDSLTLTSQLDDSTLALPKGTDEFSGDTTVGQRAPVVQATAAVDASAGRLRTATGEMYPAVVLQSTYNRFGYPKTGLPQWDQMRPDWNVVLALSMPLFTGGRIHGAKDAARATLADARLRLEQTREVAEIELQNAITTSAAAQATYDASSGTAEAAQRAYEIGQIRYHEGISTQTELADARLLLQQAQAQRAQAARALRVARLRLALFRDLPLGA
jgi:outer membrane protein TolC